MCCLAPEAKPVWVLGAGSLSAHFSAELPFSLWLGSSLKDTRPIQEFLVNLAPLTGTTNSSLWVSALPLGRHQKQLLLTSKLPHFHTSFSLLRKKIRARPVGSTVGRGGPGPCQAVGGSSHPAVDVAFLVVPRLLPASFILPEPAG